MKSIDDQLAELREEYRNAKTRLDQRIITARAGLLLMAKEKQAQKYPQSTIATPKTPESIDR